MARSRRPSTRAISIRAAVAPMVRPTKAMSRCPSATRWSTTSPAPRSSASTTESCTSEVPWWPTVWTAGTWTLVPGLYTFATARDSRAVTAQRTVGIG
ncbi:hypothetical protein [Streptomyces sp. NPDC003036]|uniref:hypothetical protein n=1 Tax=Streptomyces sp. NPDC003036 TaxID=3154442 RepID=UPI0033B75DC3